MKWDKRWERKKKEDKLENKSMSRLGSEQITTINTINFQFAYDSWPNFSFLFVVCSVGGRISHPIKFVDFIEEFYRWVEENSSKRKF